MKATHLISRKYSAICKALRENHAERCISGNPYGHYSHGARSPRRGEASLCCEKLAHSALREISKRPETLQKLLKAYRYAYWPRRLPLFILIGVDDRGRDLLPSLQCARLHAKKSSR